MNEELKPCPFCGGEANYATITGKLLGDNRTVVTHYSVNCIKCGGSNAGITQGFRKRVDARQHWNTRHES